MPAGVAERRSPVVAGLPPVTSVLTLLMTALAVVSAGADPVVAPGSLALDAGDPGTVGPWLWWLAHASPSHLAVNLTVLWYVTPQLERLVGPTRTVLVVVAGILGGAGAHTLLQGEGAPLIGASSVVAALAAYNLVIGWDRPLENRRGRAVLWPSHIFHGVMMLELVRTLAELARAGRPSGAAAHLGGLAAGVVLCGVLHGRWPSRPGSRTSLRWSVRRRRLAGRTAEQAGVATSRVEVHHTGRRPSTGDRHEERAAPSPRQGRIRSHRATPSNRPKGRLGWRGSAAGG
jgi:hypothetical protein